jgi:hypothetical protein
VRRHIQLIPLERASQSKHIIIQPPRHSRLLPFHPTVLNFYSVTSWRGSRIAEEMAPELQDRSMTLREAVLNNR